MVPWVSLMSIVGDNGRNDSTAEEFIVEPIREVGFPKRLQSCDRLGLAFGDHILANGTKFSQYIYTTMTY